MILGKMQMKARPFQSPVVSRDPDPEAVSWSGQVSARAARSDLKAAEQHTLERTGSVDSTSASVCGDGSYFPSNV